MASSQAPQGADFAAGIDIAAIPRDGVLAGSVGEETVLLAWVDGDLHAVSASCTHYGGPLGEGLRVGNEIRCPWHHACFDLRSGRATHAPAFAPLACWDVAVEDGIARVGKRSDDVADDLASAESPATASGATPQRVVIIGGGAAGFACAQRLRKRGFPGSVTMLSAAPTSPVDRPNLSKDYLSGDAQPEWIPLQPDASYRDNGIDLHTGCQVTAIDTGARQVRTRSGATHGYDALLLATGAEPRRLPGFDGDRVFVLRTLADADALLAGIRDARTVVLVGSGFIGLEAAAALRKRGLAVHVVTPDALPLQRVVGDALARRLLAVHRGHGVVFHLQAKAERFDGAAVHLGDGTRLDCDAVLVGIGVSPRVQLARDAGLAIDADSKGVRVDARLRTSADGVYAAGDIASYPHGDGLVRVEHWVHAERQGQAVAESLLGNGSDYTLPPFFWTQQHDTTLRYVGHGRGWDRVDIDGDAENGPCVARYLRDGTLVAAASIDRDVALLEIEAQLGAGPR